MRTPLCPLAALVAAGLTLLPVCPSRAAGPSAAGPILLRYRFIAGQSYGYRITLRMRMTMSGPSVPRELRKMDATMAGDLRYRILSVAPDGSATARVSMNHSTAKVAANGQTRIEPGSTEAPQTIHLAVDGSQATTVGGLDVSLQGVNALPAAPVAPGARWPSTMQSSAASLTTLGLPAFDIAARNVFVGYGVAAGRRVARIDTTAPVRYAGDKLVEGTPTHTRVTGNIIDHSFFDPAAGRTVTEDAYSDTQGVMIARAAKATATARIRLTINLSLRPQGW